MFLFGASGHAKVVIEILESRREKIEGLIDDDRNIKSLLEYPVFPFSDALVKDKKLILTIGNNIIRKKISSMVKAEFAMAIHRSAIISSRSRIGEGSVVCGGVIINVNTEIGRHCIMNTSASIDHDCIIEDFVHVSPNATLCGGVQIGEGSHIGAAAVIIPEKKIGKWCTIGAGAVVINDIPDYSTAVGNPARVIRDRVLSL